MASSENLVFISETEFTCLWVALSNGIETDNQLLSSYKWIYNYITL